MFKPFGGNGAGRPTDFKSVGPVCKTGWRFDSPCPLQALRTMKDGEGISNMEKHITIGVAGHVDHGKTAFVKCLTGIDTSRLQEEKRRGLSIESGIAPLKLPSGSQVAMVDVPGHTDFLKNTIRGLSSVDMAVLLVAADDGVMPQTVEHLRILDFFGVKGGFVVLSKADLVDNETLELAELETREILEGTFLEGTRVIPFSAIDRRGMQETLFHIEQETKRITVKNIQSPFRLWIDQVKSFAGYGTVVNGTIFSGVIKHNDSLILLPAGITTKARFLEVHHRQVAQAVAGQRAGVNLQNVPLKDVTRGMLLAEPGTINTTYLINVELQVLQGNKDPVKNRQRVMLYLGTSVTNTLVILIDKEKLKPGEKGLAQFRLLKPVAGLPRAPFVICLLNTQTVIGGGMVLEISEEKYRPAKAGTVIPRLNALKENNLKQFIEYALKSNPSRFIETSVLARSTGFQAHEIEAVIQGKVKIGELLSFKTSGVFDKRLYERIKADIQKFVEKSLHEDPLISGVKAMEIKKQLAPGIDELIFQGMLKELCDEEKLTRLDGGYRTQNVSLDLPPELSQLETLVLDYAKKSGIITFSADTIQNLQKKKLDKNKIEKLLRYLHFQEKLVHIFDGNYLSVQAFEEIKVKVAKVILQRGIFTIPDMKRIFGYTRSEGLPVLDYLDTIGFTRRKENGRILNTNIKGNKNE
ncbi:Selenocysteine-specific elongation factor SelB [uncultured Desulfobacterium sp.]|uniref:Selenocysteine-specific elongation factor n=1 Tax=uncultured Desulfobacterium sp. TaxID=201089 RepID=A0A445N0U1_9BACT|nr:Selenocysteine-specific elongation factor SelB [uncultured Desulfobacterium sp.]